MSQGQSVHLDLLRVLAALAVFGAHLCYARFSGREIGVPPHLSHGAVMVFFVLSGFVIAHVAATREADWRRYLLARAARIYSVAVPALVLTMLVDRLLLAQGLEAEIPGYQHVAPWKYLPVFLSFTTDIWFLRENAFSNLPYWSLCYEVWYYVAFAALHFLRGWRRVLGVLAVALLVGPRLWLLFPAWAMGWAVHGWQARHPLGRRAARWLMLLTALPVLALVLGPLPARAFAWADGVSGGWVGAHLRYSRFFLTDLPLAALVAAHLWAARYADLRWGMLAMPITRLAGLSFTLYLTHFPLLALWAFLLGRSPVWVPIAVLASVPLLGFVTERQKPRLQRWLARRFALA